MDWLTYGKTWKAMVGTDKKNQLKCFTELLEAKHGLAC